VNLGAASIQDGPGVLGRKPSSAQLTVEDAVGEGDLVAQRVHFTGTTRASAKGCADTKVIAVVA
jgi:hypothetical protein